jgi:hypothetical protein
MLDEKRTRNVTALEEFLRELARFALTAGVSYPQFESLAQSAFVNAGIERTKLRNARVNQSAVAALTGLNRTTIRAILRDGSSQRRGNQSPILSVLFGWTSDPEFVSAHGTARDIPKRGRRGSFERLVKKYGGDVSAKALYSELKRLSLVSERGKMLRMQRVSTESRETRDFRLLMIALTRTLHRSIPPGVAVKLGVTGGEVTYRTPASFSRVLLKRRLQQGLDAFLEDIQASAEIAAAPIRKSADRRMSKVSVLVVSQD